VTANAMPGDREQAFAAGCIGYISKPIDTRTLGDQIREYLPAERVEAGISGK
jgi:CheY-like chemotaxis protein